MIWVDYFCVCHDPSCQKQLVVPGDYRGLVLCDGCNLDFKKALKDGFPSDYDEETHNRYMENTGNNKERIDRIIDKILKENDIDIDDEE